MGRLHALGRDAMARFRIQGEPGDPAAVLSGGNQQKLLVARALRELPGVLVAVNPTRGLDIAASTFIRDELRRAALAGVGVLLISTDLEEVLELGNRIGVLFRGRIFPVEAGDGLRERIGELMLGHAA